MEFVATCAAGMEPWLADELREVADVRVRPLTGQVSWTGSLRGALTACLWSRLASRVVAIVARGKADDADGLYQLVRDLRWEDHVPHGATIAVDAHGTNAALRSTRFVAQRTKDAVADALLARAGFRPVVDLDHPDLRIVVRITRGGASVGIDLAGEPLFVRDGMRRPGIVEGIPTLRADHAAWLLRALMWHERGPAGDAALLALFSGAGTLLGEAADMACDRAPTLLRQRWGHARWSGGDAELWKALLDEARDRAELGAARSVRLMACDTRRGAEALARRALRGAGLRAEATFLSPAELSAAHGELPIVAACDLSWTDPEKPVYEATALALLGNLCERLAHEKANATSVAGGEGRLASTNSSHGDAVAKAKPSDASSPRVATTAAARGAERAAPRLSVLARADATSLAIGEPPVLSVATKLGRDAATLDAFACDDVRAPRTVDVGGTAIPVLVSASEQFAARLAKLARTRSRWARREDVTCFRVYDADLPDYNLSVDLFEGSATPGRWLQVSEYAAPRGVDPMLARARLLDAVAIAAATLRVDPADVSVRVRSRSRGGSQYASEARGGTRGGRASTEPPSSRAEAAARKGDAGMALALPSGAHLVDEGGLTFEVNFAARHDCGLFLDHRDTRSWLRELVKSYGADCRFLNLFCYTGSASVYAADGGCAHTTSVDMSAPSLAWARRNMRNNGFATGDHRFVRADALRWVADERHGRNRYDLVFCDVPTFSNSSRMGHRSFDVQRDHVELLIGVSRLLAHRNAAGDGLCVFSCNLRRFEPDVDALERAGVSIEDVTARTIPADFSRTPNVHHCYLVRRRPPARRDG